MGVGGVELSTLMAPFVEAVWRDRDRLVREVAALVTTRFASYRASPSSEVWIGMNRIFERSVVGDPFEAPVEADRIAAFGTGVQGGEAGIEAADLVAAVLLGARRVESEVMGRARAAGIDAETRLMASARARDWAEQVAVWAAEGLGSAVRRPVGDRRLVADLVAALRERRDGAAVAGFAERAGLDPAVPRLVVIVRGSGGTFTADAATLRFTHPGDGVWLEEGDTLVGIVEQRPSPTGGLVIGVGGPGVSDRLVSALSDAERASRVAQALLGAGVHGLDELGLLVPLYEGPALRAALRRRWIDPLTGPRHNLVGTMRAWQARGGRVDDVARDLDVHPNTVRNRLERIDSLLGAAWRTPKGQAEIWAALAVCGDGSGAATKN